jgi:hypothetical protein
MEILSEYLTVEEFAEAKKVPVKAILTAIEDGRIKLSGYLANDKKPAVGIHRSYLESFSIELISPYEYADRKKVSARAVYKKMDRGIIEFVVQDDLMKIDWDKYKDEYFRAVTYKFRGNKSPQQ